MKSVQKIIRQEIRVSIKGLALVAGLTLLIVAFDVVSPWPFKILIDNVFSANPLDQDSKLGFVLKFFHSRALLGFFTVFLYFISSFGLSVVQYLHSVVTKKVIKNITTRFSKLAFRNLESLAIGFYRKQEIGDYVYRMSYDVSALGNFVEDGILPLLTSGLYLAVTLTIMFFISVQLTLLSLAVLPVLTLGLFYFNAYTTYATKRSEIINSSAFTFIEEALTHLRIIQAFSEQKRQAKVFDERTESALKSDVVSYRLDFLLSLLVGVIIAVSYSFVILYGIQGVFSGALTTGLVVVFVFYLDNLTNPIISIIDAVTAARQSYIKMGRMEDFFAEKRHLERGGTIAKITDTTLRFEKVTVRGDEGKPIVHNLSFEIEPGKMTVIFGVNGSGKTSVVNLILRFIEKPSSGKIYLGGIPLEQYDIEALRRAIAFVPQEISLFDDTIRNNIAFGNPRSSWSDIRHAAHLAAATDFIKNLPGGYRFRVGEAGNFLSGGQRQRIMLARALLRNDAKIFLFDETLSALDVKTRGEVIENIARVTHGKTAIVVSNIFSVVRAADNVIVLHQGEVIYSGPSKRLQHESSLYKMIIDTI